MKRLASLLLLWIAPSPSLGLTPATNEPELIRAEWIALASPTARKIVKIEKNNGEPFIEVAPRNVYRLPTAAISDDGKPLVSSDTILTSTTNRDDLWCELDRKAGHKTIVCLIDRDRDGAADAYTKSPLASDMLIFSALYPWIKPLKQPISVLKLDPSEAPRLTVEIRYDRASMAKTNIFSFCTRNKRMGSSLASPGIICLPNDIKIKDGNFPFQFSLYGSSIQFLSASNGWAEVEIQYADGNQYF